MGVKIKVFQFRIGTRHTAVELRIILVVMK